MDHATEPPTTPRPVPARLTAVVGACGGAGASVLAAALARGLRRRVGAAALVDLDVPGAGLDVLLGVEADPGARWPDLADARGSVDAEGLVAALPRWRAVPLLSGTRERAPHGGPDDAVVLDVATALLRSGHRVVLDLPRPSGWGEATRSLVTAADAVVLVVPLTAPAVAGAMATLAALDALGTAPVHVVPRRPAPGRVDTAGVERALGRRAVATVSWDGRLAAAIERGDGPRTGRRTPLGAAAEQLVDALARPARTSGATVAAATTTGAVA
ncbi:secretion/DNA translocation related CpaE-like protein [Isoptericola sp. CG 20/1183]|uniref:Secretion/DNA translocation related CpaE-like protein n=1 Tax=Isoptericola halotolerans TaxID=300560 RepID=A0ABX5EIG7_9MICO|nr:MULTISPECIES: pilus assembly protein FlpE [Isoptericola]PRZ09467.1 secretion/DNA translocation related CpaE-like protein [Isoptericola sp. CG 20/1183]PRZ10268.1 secretion/DNA translocation related CpaE-like protein [Isoptericola halotolerans]